MRGQGPAADLNGGRGSGGLSRRRLLQSGLVAAGATLAAGALSACSGGAAGAGTPGSAAPAVADNQTVVVWNPISSYWQMPAQTTISLVERALEPFLAKNRGLRLKSAGPMQNTATTENAILGGTAPDVFPDNNIAPYIEKGLLLDLSKYMRQDNVSTDLFATSQMAKFSKLGTVYALPSYIGTTVMLVNQAILDGAGLTYPQPDWTYQQWTTLFQATTKGVGSKRRYGTSIFGGIGTAFYYHGFGASIVDPTDPRKCGLGQPGAVAAANWISGLLKPQIAFNNGGGQQHTQQLFKASQVAAPVLWIQMLPHWVPILQGMKWDLYQMPLWPAQPATFANSDFWAISGNTKVPDAAWALLKEICVGRAYSELLMKAALFPPGLKSLWPSWVATVKAVAPPLRNKNLEVFAQYVLTNHAYPGLDFAYGNATATSLVASDLNRIVSGQVSAQLGLQQAVARVNAYEAAAASAAAPVAKGVIDQFPQPAGG